MNRLITQEDFNDLVIKAKQRGLSFLLSKLNLNKISRTKNTFNQASINTSNWWDIDFVKKRRNRLITGNANLDYPDFIAEHITRENKKARLISIGSGSCTTELKLAKHSCFSEILCLDLSNVRLNEGARYASAHGFKSLKFMCADFYEFDYKPNHYDYVLFNSSLHHIKDIDSFLKNKILKTLKPQGSIIVNEYIGPNRLQYNKDQLSAINTAISMIPEKYRVRYNTNIIKRKYYGSGLLRMIIADPSECIESANILPCLHKYFIPIMEKPYGGNILMSTLKDIAYHFTELDLNKKKVLESLFAFEDAYLKNNSSDFIFGIYQKK